MIEIIDVVSVLPSKAFVGRRSSSRSTAISRTISLRPCWCSSWASWGPACSTRFSKGCGTTDPAV